MIATPVKVNVLQARSLLVWFCPVFAPVAHLQKLTENYGRSTCIFFRDMICLAKKLETLPETVPGLFPAKRQEVRRERLDHY